MANSPQARKRIRRNNARTVINHSRLSRIRTAIKRVETALASGDKGAATDALSRHAARAAARRFSKGVFPQEHRRTEDCRVSPSGSQRSPESAETTGIGAACAPASADVSELYYIRARTARTSRESAPICRRGDGHPLTVWKRISFLAVLTKFCGSFLSSRFIFIFVTSRRPCFAGPVNISSKRIIRSLR